VEAAAEAPAAKKAAVEAAEAPAAKKAAVEAAVEAVPGTVTPVSA